MSVICETERLVIRHFNTHDADFIVRLLNEESFIRHIADKQVRTVTDAVNYLISGPIASYQTYGFGLNIVSLKGTETPIGMCGLLKRDELSHPDLGYAFLPEFCGKGYAIEAAYLVLITEMSAHNLDAVLAVTSPDNTTSNNLLVKIGFILKEQILLYGCTNNLYQYAKKNITFNFIE